MDTGRGTVSELAIVKDHGKLKRGDTIQFHHHGIIVGNAVLITMSVIIKDAFSYWPINSWEIPEWAETSPRIVQVAARGLKR